MCFLPLRVHLRNSHLTGTQLGLLHWPMIREGDINVVRKTLLPVDVKTVLKREAVSCFITNGTFDGN